MFFFVNLKGATVHVINTSVIWEEEHRTRQTLIRVNVVGTLRNGEQPHDRLGCDNKLVDRKLAKKIKRQGHEAYGTVLTGSTR